MRQYHTMQAKWQITVCIALLLITNLQARPGESLEELTIRYGQPLSEKHPIFNNQEINKLKKVSFANGLDIRFEFRNALKKLDAHKNKKEIIRTLKNGSEVSQLLKNINDENFLDNLTIALNKNSEHKFFLYNNTLIQALIISPGGKSLKGYCISESYAKASESDNGEWSISPMSPDVIKNMYEMYQNDTSSPLTGKWGEKEEFRILCATLAFMSGVRDFKNPPKYLTFAAQRASKRNFNMDRIWLDFTLIGNTSSPIFDFIEIHDGMLKTSLLSTTKSIYEAIERYESINNRTQGF